MCALVVVTPTSGYVHPAMNEKKSPRARPGLAEFGAANGKKKSRGSGTPRYHHELANCPEWGKPVHAPKGSEQSGATAHGIR